MKSKTPKGSSSTTKLRSKLKIGDTVMVVAGGHKFKRPNKGQVGKILAFAGENKDRVLVEGLNIVTVHQRARVPGQTSQKVQRPGSIHISNVMYYAEAHKRPVRLKSSTLADGTKVRGYLSPETGEFEQI